MSVVESNLCERPLIDDEAFPTIGTIRNDQRVYKKIENEPDGAVSAPLPHRRGWIGLFALSAIVLFSCISLIMYVSNLLAPSLSPSVNRSYSSSQRNPDDHFNELLRSPLAVRKSFHQSLTERFRMTHSPPSWTEKEWEETFRSYLQHFHAGDSFLIRNFYKRLAIFKSNVLSIHNHNRNRESDVSLRVNQFAHLSFPEFKGQFLNLDGESLEGLALPKFEGDILGSVTDGSVPKSINWVERGCVTPVKDQAKCGSCWAFSSTGSIEGGICAHGGQLISLSEQELVDCAKPEGAEGCNGGYMDNAFQYVLDSMGICSEKDYPYSGKEGECKNQRCSKVASIKGILSIPKDDEKAMKAALASYGPISAGVEADKASFQFYHSGIFSLPCGKKLNHAILLVGYGIDEATKESYWLVKNSWGPAWGDAGYIKLARKGHGKKGECGILLSPTAPLIGENL